MKCTIPEISWHNRDPVLSVDIQPILNNDFYRLATGGTDSHVLVNIPLFLYKILSIFYFSTSKLQISYKNIELYCLVANFFLPQPPVDFNEINTYS